MRHRKAGRKLKRTASHRKATLAALATSLLRHKRITTTVAKAKETRGVVERLITRAKRALAKAGAEGNSAENRSGKFLQSAGPARREVSRVIKDRSVVSELFSTVAPKVASRPGGYTRIVKLGQRQGDGAELAVIELVDFQAGQEAEKKPEGAKEKKKEAGKRKKEEKPRPAAKRGKEKAGTKESAAAEGHPPKT